MKIKLQNISKKYNDNQIIKHLNYEFNSGNVYFIIGQSGSGKTTLLKTIANIDKDYEGNIMIDDMNINDIDETYLNTSVITYIDQYSTLIPYLSIKQNAKFILNKDIHKGSDKRFRLYSGGEKRRISSFVSLLKKTDIILADEISSSLDKDNAIKVMEYLRSKAKNKILIVVTHDLFLIKEDDIVIDMDDQDSISFIKSNTSDRKHRTKKQKKYLNNRGYFNLSKYSYLKVKDNKKQMFNFVSSFMVGLVLILLIASLKSGILSFLNDEVLNGFDYNYLLLENPNNEFRYGDNELFEEYCEDSILLLDDFYFDQLKNQIYYYENGRIIYILISDSYCISSELLKENNYDYNFSIMNYSIFINNFFDSPEYIIKCPASFFNNYYQFKNYRISDLKTKNIVLHLNKNQNIYELYSSFNDYFKDIKICNVGVDAYLYIENILDKLSFLLGVFACVSLFITFFLVYTIIYLDIEDDQKEIFFLKTSGWKKEEIFRFYYLANIIRGVITFLVTICFYFIVIYASNKMLKNQLGVAKNILKITLKSQGIIIFLIFFIITLSMFLSKKKLTRCKK